MAKRKDNAAIVAERFPIEIANHVMTIVKDDGLHRHVMFRNPDSGFYWFELVTWPGFLCVSGDCGCYVFSRIQDMFEFFREVEKPNFSYWGEKVQTVDRQCPVMEYSEDEFRETVKEEIEQISEGESASYRKELERQVKDSLWHAKTNDRESAVDAMTNFVFRGRHPFRDFWEHSCQDYTIQYVWCCHAILWGIQQYDAAKAKVEEPALTA